MSAPPSSLLTVLLLMTLAASAGEPSVRPAVIGEAEELVASGGRAQARTLLDSLLAHADSLDAEVEAEARYLQTLLEEDGPRYEELLRSLLVHEPDPYRQAWAHLSLGRIAFARGELETALEEFAKAKALGREEEGALWEGLTAFALGEGETARQALERASRAGRSAIRQRAWIVLGDLHRMGDNWAEAIASYGKVREDGGEGSGWWAVATFREAECHEKIGEAEEAQALYRELLTRMPGSYEAPLGRARLQDGLVPSAEEDIEAASPLPGTEKTGESYAVQVGAFAEEANAERLANRVGTGGFGPVRVLRGEDDLFRVVVGRFPDRGRAETLGDTLSATFGLGFSVVRDGSR